MGYTTDFYGQFELDRPLAPKHAEYLNQFSETRRMKRNAGVAAKLPDPTREAAGLPIGTEGEYFVGAGGDFGQNSDESVLDYSLDCGVSGYQLKTVWVSSGTGQRSSTIMLSGLNTLLRIFLSRGGMF